MTFWSRETSRRSGAPLQLLRVTLGSTVYLLTPSDVSVVYASETYTPAPLTITPPASGRGDLGILSFTLPSTHALAVALRTAGIAEVPAVTLYEQHRGDTEVLATFLGDVAGADQAREILTVRCQSVTAMVSRKLPTLTIATTCGNMLYDARCQIAAATFAYTTGTVSAISGRVITITGLGTFAGTDTTYFVAGVLLKAGVIMGFIVQQDGDTITLLTDPPPALAVSDAVTVQAGCDRTINTCRTRFANQKHINAWHVRPMRNPFTGRGLRP